MLLTLKDVESFTTMPKEDTYFLQRKGQNEAVPVYLIAKDLHVFWDGDISKYRSNDSISFCYRNNEWYLDMDMEEMVSYGTEWRLFDVSPTNSELANF